MKTTELIKYLDNILKMHGDLPVYYCDYDQNYIEPILSSYPIIDQHGKSCYVILDNGRRHMDLNELRLQQ